MIEIVMLKGDVKFKANTDEGLRIILFNNFLSRFIDIKGEEDNPEL